MGRQPLRKLSRHERFIGPAAELAEAGRHPAALLEAIGAALRFEVPEDDQSVELHRLLREQSAEKIVTAACGLDSAHPLFADLVRVVAEAKRR